MNKAEFMYYVAHMGPCTNKDIAQESGGDPKNIGSAGLSSFRSGVVDKRKVNIEGLGGRANEWMLKPFHGEKEKHESPPDDWVKIRSIDDEERFTGLYIDPNGLGVTLASYEAGEWGGVSSSVVVWPEEIDELIDTLRVLRE